MKFFKKCRMILISLLIALIYIISINYNEYIFLRTPVIEENQQLNESDFIISDENIILTLDMTIDESYLKNSVEIKELTDKKTNEVIIFNDYKIKLDSVSNKIISIELTSSQYSTYRGIKIGNSLKNVFELYGDYDSKVNNHFGTTYIYYFYEKMLIFNCNNENEIVSIVYEVL